MTCREKLMKECPNKVRSDQAGGCKGCPSDYFMISDPPWCSYGDSSVDCTRCWAREYKEDRKDLKEETIVEIEGILMNSDLKWQIIYDPANSSYHIDID